MDSPYLRIVADIRRRIAAGELRPGDPVPSARRICRDWGVAIATATKVHAALRREGLTRAVPGVGTVVVGPAVSPPPARRPAVAGGGSAAAYRPRGSGREPGAEINRERIVLTAIDIADAEGMGEVSMRRIAAELRAATMSLYRHVSGKEELILHMVDAALGERDAAPVTGERRSRLAYVGRSIWRVFRRHPWLAGAMSLTRPQLVPNALSIADEVLGALAGTGLNPEEQLYVHLTLFSFVRGLATALEAESEAQRETGLDNEEWMRTQEPRLDELVPAGSALRPLIQSDIDFDLDRLFEFGLNRLLDGLQV
ncbi:TetR/AcrR family transcriptional regulator C-terminal domain-containing protein [Krasilnikovia sp. M28-CT-15]|uniref:TetR/AcrR family transcriptional regulator C-terminal domain-containing protein n=1 Tax=Krasilnikovia sp. M28-CT-15 TaxID=3373540 RepID=UPI003875EDFC